MTRPLGEAGWMRCIRSQTLGTMALALVLTACRGLGLTPGPRPEGPQLVVKNPLEVLADHPSGDLLRVLAGLAMALAILILGRWSRRARFGLGVSGLVRAASSTLSRLATSAAMVAIVWGVWVYIPHLSNQAWWAVLCALVLVVLGLGWTVLLDMGASLLMRLERRLSSGVRIKSEDVSGSVVRIGYRTVRVLTGRGPVEVPSRWLIYRPVQVGVSTLRQGRGIFRRPVRRQGAEHEVRVRFESREGFAETRHRIADAVLASAWVSTRPDVRIAPEPLEPGVWVVRCRVLDARFAPRFDAGLVESLHQEVDSKGSDVEEDLVVTKDV